MYFEGSFHYINKGDTMPSKALSYLLPTKIFLFLILSSIMFTSHLYAAERIYYLSNYENNKASGSVDSNNEKDYGDCWVGDPALDNPKRAWLEFNYGNYSGHLTPF